MTDGDGEMEMDLPSISMAISHSKLPEVTDKSAHLGTFTQFDLSLKEGAANVDADEARKVLGTPGLNMLIW